MFTDCRYCKECESWIDVEDIVDNCCGICGEEKLEAKVFSCTKCNVCGKLKYIAEMEKTNIKDCGFGEIDFDYVCSNCVEDIEQRESDEHSYRTSVYGRKR